MFGLVLGDRHLQGDRKMGSDSMFSPKVLHDAQELLGLDEREHPSTVFLRGQLLRDFPPEAGEHAGEHSPVGATRQETRYPAGPPRVRNTLEIIVRASPHTTHPVP